MHKIKWNDLKNILKITLIFIIPMSIAFISFYNYLSKQEIEKTKAIILGEQNERAKVIDYIIEDIFKDINEDILVVKNSNEVANYINQETEENLRKAEQLLLRFSKSKKNFEQLALIDAKGQEIAKVNNGQEIVSLASQQELGNIKNEDAYIKARELKNGEIYISDLYLNQQNGKIVSPDEPLIQVVLPLYGEKKEYKGMLVVKYLGQNILNLFEKQFEDTEYGFIKPLLINQDGYYLYNKEKNNCFGFLFDEKKNETLAIEDPEGWSKINATEIGNYQTDNIIKFFKKLSPLSKIEMKTGGDFNWYIVSEFDLESLPVVHENVFWGMRIRDIVMLLGIIFSTFFIITLNYYSKKNKNQLDVTLKIAENTNDAVVITDKDTNIIYVNNAFEKATGYNKSDVLGLKTNYFKSGKQSNEFYTQMWNSIVNLGMWSGELWDKKKDDVLYPKKLSIFSIKNKMNGAVDNYVAMFKDLTKEREEQKYLNKLKNYSLETDLPNERLLMTLIDKSISLKPSQFCLIYFSISDYNNIMIKVKEDSNSFIKALISRIKNMLKTEDFIAQITKESFVMGLSSEQNYRDVEEFVTRFSHENRQPLVVQDTEIFLTIKSGVCIYPEDGGSSNELLINAYIALKSVMEQKDKEFLFYKANLKETIEKEIEMEACLRKAIVNKEFKVYYQPQVEIEPERVVGEEALLRWNCEQLGAISPVVFIPLAERTGQIIEIGYWLIEQIFMDYCTIKDKISRDFRISINLSPLQFKDTRLLAKIKELGKKYEINFKHFEIEITEGIFIDDIYIVNEKLDKFREIGMTVAIDDFGTGFSSLSYLKKLSVDKLKIDRSFIKDYPENDGGEIAKVITDISKELKLKVITEGAETKAQIEYLKSVGCNLIQGFYYSRPLPKEEFEYYLLKK